ncbi:hypothetical protein ABZ863_27075 [Saccharomonospora sp. NPDC046836]|uniref:hypothetical protein n=1 Tax=Saccharomonospora sp. NPDC046836 TaxID=3156921 RepID=UPI0033D1ECF0
MTYPQQDATNLGFNSGSGSFYQGVDQHFYEGPLLSSRPVARDFVEAAREAFVPVDHLDKARRTLESSPLLVIVGAPHTGRRTAAVHLLNEVRPRNVPSNDSRMIREFDVDWSTPDTRLIRATSGGDYLLDLSDEDDVVTPKFVDALVGLNDNLNEAKARLVVLATHTIWSDPSGAASSIMRELGQPDAHEVLRRHVEWRTADEAMRNRITQDQVREAIATLTKPADAAALARVVATVEEPEALHKAVAQIAAWPSFLRKHFDQIPRGIDDLARVADIKLLLVATAAMEGSATGFVYSAYDALLAEFAAPRNAFKALADPGFTRRLSLLDASVEADQVHLTTSRPGADLAVLRYFWREYPFQRPNLLNWFGAIVSIPGPSARNTERLGSIIVALASEADNNAVRNSITKWLTGNERQRALVSATLVAGLASDGFRSDVLTLLREWAQSTSAVHQGIVAEFCQNEGMPLQRALVRLKWILDNPANSAIADKAGEALRVLASRDRDSAALVLSAVQSWASRWPAAAARGFVMLLAAGEGIAFAAELLRQARTDSEIMHRLRDGWVGAWTLAQSRDHAARALCEWGAAIDDGRLDDHAEDLLVEAVTTHLLHTKSLEPFLPSRDRSAPARDSAHYRIVKRATSALMLTTDQRATENGRAEAVRSETTGATQG